MFRSSGRRLVYLNSHPLHAARPFHVADHAAPCLAVAISAQTGSGAFDIAEQLAKEFQAHASVHEPPWRVLGKGLMTRVLEDHRLPARLAKFLPEDANNTIDDVLDELFGLHPPSWVIAQQSIETVLSLARAGNIILVGWGVNAITHKLSNVFHVRLVGSLERRIARVQMRENLNFRDASALVQRSDRGRARYVKTYFRHEVGDAILYDLTINTDRLADADVVRLIANTVPNRRPAGNSQAGVVGAQPSFT